MSHVLRESGVELIHAHDFLDLADRIALGYCNVIGLGDEVELVGLEPTTPSMPWKCSPS